MDDVTRRVVDKTLNRHFGKFRGEVVNNNDPLNRGRLQVKVKTLMRDVPFWAMPCMPFGGNGMGMFMIPENGAGVYVEFEGGDLNLPIWTGCYWTDNNQSPKDNKTAEPKVRLIRSEKGLTISLDDQDEIVTISDKDDKNTITIDVNKGTVKIKGNQTVVVDAQNVQLGGEFGLEPVVKGATLLAYLNAMVLTAKPAVPGTVVLPPPPNILSGKVKTV